MACGCCCMVCPTPCSPKRYCMMYVRPMPPRLCCNPCQPDCKCSGRCNRWCCRPKWDSSFAPKDAACKLDLCFPCLPPLSCRYNTWICNNSVRRTDSNLIPSLVSGSVEKKGCNLVAVDPPAPYDCGPPCPCHCPNPGQC